MRWWWGVVVLALAGCVRAGFDSGDVNVDSAVVDSAAEDSAAADGATADSAALPDMGEPHTWSFTVSELSSLNSGLGDDDPSMTPNLLEILFDSNRSGKDAVWHATRASPTASWSPPSMVTVLSSLGSTSNPLLSPDGLGVHVAYSGDMYVSSRATLGGTWSAPKKVTELSTGANESRAAVTADGFYLVLDRTISGTRTLLDTTRSTPSGTWGTPQPIAALGTTDANLSPWLNADGTLILFSSNRPGGAGKSDIWVATRASRTVPFGAPKPLASVNTQDTEEDPWLSPDRRTLLFARSVGGIKRVLIGVR